ncbi:MAG: sulfite exporter TauE/SafE family protein [Phaeovulum sp.]|uniref:sulfite exporter TauE/SafE family protein n=1 Tax=Phaeovulum sp. TaxID=2934796 RepID=UPI0027309074|nr:sulfite exporter TauE/SafE family protein [Phaeovulum sp.]MDP2063648.1 sulfite exporter TauE/SafE family protein [Phaeovulum sp.]
MDLSAAGWVLAVAAAVLVGLSKGGLPVVSMLAVPMLALVMSPVAAAGLLLPVYVVSDMFGLWAWRKAYDRRVLAIVAPAAVLGIGLGWATASMVSDRMVGGLVGLIGTLFALNAIIRPRIGGAREARPGPGIFWGTIAGFTSFVSHSGGPPWQIYALPLGMDKLVFAGTSTILFAWINAVKLVPYYALGQLSGESLRLAVLLMAPAALAVLTGVRLVRVIPQDKFFRIVTWALLAMSLSLLWKAV